MLKSTVLLLSGSLLYSANACAEPVLDPFELARSASDRLSPASSVSVHVEKRFDVMLNNGAKVEYSGALQVLSSKSAGLFMDYGDDLSARQVWYDGSSMTMLDPLKNLYVTIPVEGSVAVALTTVSEKHGLDLPLKPLTGDAAAQGATAAASAAEVGRHLSNPTSDVWALFTEFDYTKYNGTLTGGEDSKTVGFSMIFQPITPIPLTRNWKLLTRPVIPIIFSTPVPGVDGAGINFDRKSGLGDIALPLILAKNHGIKLGKGRLIGGVGPTFQFPTATNDALGSETWETGIAGLAVYKTPKWIWIANPQYWWSTGRSDDDAPHTSHGSLLYGVFYEAGNAWQVGLSPTITYDAEASSGNRWNVPIGLMVAKTTKIGKRMIKFQVAFEYSVVNQDAYGKEFMLRFNVIPVVTSPFSKPLF